MFFIYVFLNFIAGTVEATIYYLNKFKSIISLWDEASSFLCAFGRYSGGGSSAALYDRSVYNELFNSGQLFLRDLKGSIRLA